MKKAIVFGGSGFLGSHVADELTNNNFDVTIFDLKKSKYRNKKQKMITVLRRYKLEGTRESFENLLSVLKL